MQITSPAAASALPTVRSDDATLRKAADAFEATFLAEMLKAAGLGSTPDAFGGGAGEDQFASFLVAEQAKAMVASGGIGLSESVFQALKEDRDAQL